MNSIHISTVRRILKAPEPVDIKCWTKSGGIMELHNAIPLRYDFYERNATVQDTGISADTHHTAQSDI